jgi:DNA-binding NarL/FixJ family response regulator
VKPIRVVIADDHPVFRFGMRALLDAEPDIEVLDEATTGEQAVEMAVSLKPDLVLMDINMPGIHGIEATRQVLEHDPSIGVLIVTMIEDDTVLAALRAGARGYLLKGAEGEETLNAIRTVASGGSVFSPKVADRVLGFMVGTTAASHRPFPDLTEREFEILEMMARGLTNTAIANRLVISEKTVRNYVSNIFKKIQVTSRGEAIALAHQAGIGGK